MKCNIIIKRSIRTLCIAAVALCATVVTSCHSSKNSSAKKPDKTVVMPADATQAERLIAEARSWTGVPYKHGGTDRNGTDCSGFLQQVYLKALNIRLPRSTDKQRTHCSPVARKDIAPGDIVFFSSRRSEGKVAHVGMYTGNGRMIHASSSRGVVEDDMQLKYYVTHYIGAGRPPELVNHPAVKAEPKNEFAVRPVADTVGVETVDIVEIVEIADIADDMTKWSTRKPVKRHHETAVIAPETIVSVSDSIVHASEPSSEAGPSPVADHITTFAGTFDGRPLILYITGSEKDAEIKDVDVNSDDKTEEVIKTMEQSAPHTEQNAPHTESKKEEPSQQKETNPQIEVKQAFGKATKTEK